MRCLLVVFAIAAVQLVSAVQAKYIDGVRVFGRTHDLSVQQIHAVIAEAADNSPRKRKPRAIEVLTSTEVRAYLPEREMGWVRYRLTPWAAPWHDRPPKWTLDGFGINNTPEALRLIRTAEQVYVCPVTLSNDDDLTLHGEYKRRRLLGADETRKLARLLGTKNHWFNGADNTIGIPPYPKNVGFIFRKGRDELVLLCYMRWRVAGTFNGEYTCGSLDEKWSDRLDDWKRQYARPELGLD